MSGATIQEQALIDDLEAEIAVGHDVRRSGVGIALFRGRYPYVLGCACGPCKDGALSHRRDVGALVPSGFWTWLSLTFPIGALATYRPLPAEALRA